MADDTELVLEGEALEAEGPCVEEGAGRVVIPSRGKLFDSDGRVDVAIIRPCVSRGKRLRGMPPIYEGAMLGRNAGVFADWHMWMGHMSQPLKEAIEALEEQLQEAVSPRRLFSELGGRVVETWYNPSFRTKHDDDFGHRPGAIMGKVIPYPAARQILEADPDGLHVSIAAWPTAAREATASWDKSIRGMAIEGFRRAPRGSVDWVLRGGAGGRPVTAGLTEMEQTAVAALAEHYHLIREDDMPQYTNETLQSLREGLMRENPALAAEVFPTTAPAAPAATATATPGLTEADLQAALAQRDAQHAAALLEQEQRLTATLTESLEESLGDVRKYNKLAELAEAQIKGAGLPRTWEQDVLRRYSVLTSGPASGLLAESADPEKTPEQVIAESVEADLRHARTLIAESAGVPRVRDLGGAANQVQENATGGAKPANTLFRDFLSESEDLGDKPEDKIKTMIREGVSL